jgi:hemerythrin-like metal-binding protein
MLIKFESLSNKKMDILKSALIVMLGIDILIIIIGWLLAYFNIVRPLKYLSNITAKIGLGDFNQKIMIKHTNDEIGELATSFNRMLKDLQKVFKDVTLSQKALVSSLAALADGRDPETGSHLERTKQYAMLLAQDLQRQGKYKGQITQDFIEDIYNAASLHDIGKVGISDSILLKPGKLTDDEFNDMKRHVTIGRKVLDTAIDRFGIEQSLFVVARNICQYHHEKYNGKGYNVGLIGDAIPLEARIFSVCDVYDALRSKRPYKDEMSHESAIEIIYKDSGQSFDPQVIDALARCETNFIDIHNSYKYLYLMFCQIYETNSVGNLSYINFEEKFQVGVKEIDDQLRIIFDQIQFMLKSINTGKWSDEIVKTIKLMGVYVNFYFKLEEDYMYKKNYPAIKFHIQQHEILKNNLIDITNRLKENNNKFSVISELTLKFAQEIISHIMTIDKALGEFLSRDLV